MGCCRPLLGVNRISEEEGVPDKAFGLLIDYTGVLKNLAAAVASYDALQGFSVEDIARSVVAIRDETNKVSSAHAALLDVVKSVSNTFDEL
jgi:type I restriction enzyme, R subunit